MGVSWSADTCFHAVPLHAYIHTHPTPHTFRGCPIAIAMSCCFGSKPASSSVDKIEAAYVANSTPAPAAAATQADLPSARGIAAPAAPEPSSMRPSCENPAIDQVRIALGAGPTSPRASRLSNVKWGMQRASAENAPADSSGGLPTIKSINEVLRLNLAEVRFAIRLLIDTGTATTCCYIGEAGAAEAGMRVHHPVDCSKRIGRAPLPAPVRLTRMVRLVHGAESGSSTTVVPLAASPDSQSTARPTSYLRRMGLRPQSSKRRQ